MSNYSPATRAAFAVFILGTVIIFAATALIIADRTRTAEAVEKERLLAISVSIATLVDDSEAQQRPITDANLATIAAENGLDGIAILHRRGRILASSDPIGLRAINWTTVVEETTRFEAVRTANWDGKDYFMALRPAISGERVAVLKSTRDVYAASSAGSGGIAIGAIVAWLLLGIGLIALSLFAGKRTAERLDSLAHRLAALERFDDNSADAQIGIARQSIGPFADSFETMVEVLKAGHTRFEESRSQIAALLQINPHYVIMCTMDGQIVDANPAFYAVTGLPFAAVRGQRIEALHEVMPIEPLFDLARRSLHENSSISGIEYAIVNREDVRRAVQVSLRAVIISGKAGVLIQATDVANQRNLERQISTFSDALDLMVDQRVAQLTAGNTSINRLLDEAGVILASFDAGGGTRRWNRTTHDLTGRTVQQVPHFTAFVSVLGFSDTQKQQFNGWFWGESERSYAMDVHSAAGPVRRILWRKSLSSEDGGAESRVLIGMDMPRMVPHTGDGIGGELPNFQTPSPRTDN